MLPKFDNFKSQKIRNAREILPAGGYVCKILKAETLTTDWGMKLVLSFDITEGEFTNFFKTDYNDQPEDRKKWRGVWRINYPTGDGSEQDTWKQKTINNLAACLEESNPGFAWDWDETKLKGKAIGILFREFDWEMDGRSGTSTEAHSCTDVESIRAGKFRIGKKRALRNTAPAAAPDHAADDDDLPF